MTHFLILSNCGFIVINQWF